ncbi:homoserine dehydrogenase [Streptomyces luteoverticillatus]|uniref:Homoserine dehydrogenase n=1 Tax=Streptomyces luteoverticillatus TaxID=66425 RepID=A0A3Q9G0E9_STRLT|nr:homoserine dehydrogenase [Streptomyces luteoverticillatus]AZQ74434.1 homoserine dehydrogenase [Streptomyces luteoverticillatus]
MARTRPLKVAVLGCGVVGTEVVRRLHGAGAEWAGRVGAPVEIAGVAVRDLARPRDAGIDPALWTDDPLALVKRDDIDIVVELLGGVEPARSLVVTALEHGASVVSANKALLAEHGPSLHGTAAEQGVDLFYEAAVAAAVPLLRPLRESLGGDDVTRVTGIVNGTTNYILDRMTRTGSGFEPALREAVEQGFAEADPTADVSGADAAAKAVILTALAFRTRLDPADVYLEGITEVTATDVADARSRDRVVKLVAMLERAVGREEVLVRVHPAMVARTHPLAGVGGADNAVLVETAAAGPLLFRGAGAGGAPTAGAVLGDLVTAARRRLLGHRETVPPVVVPGHVRPMADLRTRYHLGIDVADPAEALAEVAVVLRTHGLRTDSVRRRRAESGRDRLVLETSVVREADLLAALASIATLPSVAAPPRLLRLIDPVDGLGDE